MWKFEEDRERFSERGNKALKYTGIALEYQSTTRWRTFPNQLNNKPGFQSVYFSATICHQQPWWHLTFDLGCALPLCLTVGSIPPFSHLVTLNTALNRRNPRLHLWLWSCGSKAEFKNNIKRGGKEHRGLQYQGSTSLLKARDEKPRWWKWPPLIQSHE